VHCNARRQARCWNGGAAAGYEVGRFGFVIDPNRHQVYGGPSDFVGWQGGKAT